MRNSIVYKYGYVICEEYRSGSGNGISGVYGYVDLYGGREEGGFGNGDGFGNGSGWGIGDGCGDGECYGDGNWYEGNGDGDGYANFLNTGMYIFLQC